MLSHLSHKVAQIHSQVDPGLVARPVETPRKDCCPVIWTDLNLFLPEEANRVFGATSSAICSLDPRPSWLNWFRASWEQILAIVNLPHLPPPKKPGKWDGSHVSHPCPTWPLCSFWYHWPQCPSGLTLIGGGWYSAGQVHFLSPGLIPSGGSWGGEIWGTASSWLYLLAHQICQRKMLHVPTIRDLNLGTSKQAVFTVALALWDLLPPEARLGPSLSIFCKSLRTCLCLQT